MPSVMKKIGIGLLVTILPVSILFLIYFFNLDMKLSVKVIAPLLEKIYDKRERKQYV